MSIKQLSDTVTAVQNPAYRSYLSTRKALTEMIDNIRSWLGEAKRSIQGFSYDEIGSELLDEYTGTALSWPEFIVTVSRDAHPESPNVEIGITTVTFIYDCASISVGTKKMNFQPEVGWRLESDPNSSVDRDQFFSMVATAIIRKK